MGEADGAILFSYSTRRQDDRRSGGADLPDIEAAQYEAIAAAREMLTRLVLAGQPIRNEAIVVQSSDDSPIVQVPLRSVIHFAEG